MDGIVDVDDLGVRDSTVVVETPCAIGWKERIRNRPRSTGRNGRRTLALLKMKQHGNQMEECTLSKGYKKLDMINQWRFAVDVIKTKELQVGRK